MPADKRSSNGVYVTNRAVDERQNKVNIVNEQIKRNADVCRTECKPAGSFRMNVSRQIDVLSGFCERGIEPFNVSDLQNRAGFSGRVEHIVALVGRNCQRLFH